MRWPRWIKRIAWRIATTLPLLLALPLAGQQTVVVPDVNVVVDPTPITIENTVEVMSDSAMIANLNRNLEALRLEIAAQECNTCGGGSTVVRIGQGALVLIAAFMAWQVKKIADKPNGDTNVEVNEGDTDVTVENNLPERDKHKRGGH